MDSSKIGREMRDLLGLRMAGMQAMTSVSFPVCGWKSCYPLTWLWGGLAGVSNQSAGLGIL